MFSDRDNSDPNLLSVNWIDPIIPLTYICILLSESIARNGFVQLCQFGGRFYRAEFASSWIDLTLSSVSGPCPES